MRRRIWSAIGVALLVSACAAARETGQADPERPATLARLQASREAGRTGSVWGFLYLGEPGVPIPLKDWSVELLPLTPGLEAEVRRAQQAYRAGDYAPLPFQALNRLKQALDTSRAQLRDGGYGDLIRQVKTETGADPKFEFRDIPEGRWLLLAELPSPATLAVWVVPVDVSAGTVAKQSLNDHTVIEGMTR